MAAEMTLPERSAFAQRIFQLMNGAIAVLLRSPLHGPLSASTLLLRFSGRKSGKIYTFPVGYYDYQGDTLALIPLHDWWKNLRGGVPVTVWLKGHRLSGTAQASMGDAAAVAELERLIAGSKYLRRLYKIKADAAGQIDLERTHSVAAALPLVRIRLNPRA